jgi:uncharacterized membrane protein YfcA
MTVSVSRRSAVLVCVGVAAGFLSGVFGIGGGILIVPGLMYAAKMDARRAHGTSLAAVLPISVASLIAYARGGNVDLVVGAWLAAGAMTGAYIGTALLAVIAKRKLAIAFSFLLVVAGVRLFFDVSGGGRASLDVVSVVGLVLVGVATGAIAGLLGLGGGIVLVPYMTIVEGIPAVIAKGTAVAVTVPTAMVGTWRNRVNNNVDIVAALLVGIPGIVLAFAGAWVSARISDTASNVSFAVLIMIVATRTIGTAIREKN